MLLRRDKARVALIRVPMHIRRAIRNRAEWAAQELLAAQGKAECDDAIVPWFMHAVEASGDDERTIMVGFEDGTVVRSTLVRPQSTLLDEDLLRKKIGERAYTDLCNTVIMLDQDKLAQAIASGKVSKHTVDSCTVAQPRKPYVKHTVKAGTQQWPA